MMQRKTAEAIRDGKGWYWPPNSRKVHYYGQDNRTVCGRGFVLVLPDKGLDGFESPTCPDDCAGCAKRVREAQSVFSNDTKI